LPALQQCAGLRPLPVAAHAPGVAKPTGLRCDSLIQPLGIDTAKPVLSWRLVDDRDGAKQTSYEITVSSSASGKAKIWDSGRITSALSSGVPYGGPALEPSHRYFWWIAAWDRNGKAYPVSDTSWWETGLMEPTNWKAVWIGHEPAELHSLRESHAAWISNAKVPGYATRGDTHHDFRFQFSLSKPVERADLYTTGEDATSAWVNGKQVRVAEALPKWKQMPWGTYEKQEVTAELRAEPI